MESALLAVIGSSLAAGLSGSLHCAVMCGPLACAQGRPLAWHAGRALGYAATGAALGSVGAGVLVQLSAARALMPWVMAAGLVATAFELGRHLPSLPGVGGLVRRAVSVTSAWPVRRRSFVVGALTPLLPCGLLFGLFFTSVGTGSAVGGAASLLAFALGSVPALLGAQASARALARRPMLTWTIRTGVPLLAAVVLIVRALTDTPDAPGCGHTDGAAGFLDSARGEGKVSSIAWKAPTSTLPPSTVSSQEP